MEITKKEAEALYSTFIHAFNEGAAKTVACFDQDAVIEYPYSNSEETRKQNKEQYFQQLKGVLKQMGPFTIHSFVVYGTDIPGTFWATLDVECPVSATGKIFRQNYVQRFSVNEKLKFTHYVEYFNPMKSKEAFS
jgi:ketosteroid isomerase-like protein